jgi:hypothetical protein
MLHVLQLGGRYKGGHPDPLYLEGEGKIKQSPEKPFDKLRTNGLG